MFGFCSLKDDFNDDDNRRPSSDPVKRFASDQMKEYAKSKRIERVSTNAYEEAGRDREIYESMVKDRIKPDKESLKAAEYNNYAMHNYSRVVNLPIQGDRPLSFVASIISDRELEIARRDYREYQDILRALRGTD